MWRRCSGRGGRIRRCEGAVAEGQGFAVADEPIEVGTLAGGVGDGFGGEVEGYYTGRLRFVSDPLEKGAPVAADVEDRTRRLRNQLANAVKTPVVIDTLDEVGLQGSVVVIGRDIVMDILE